MACVRLPICPLLLARAQVPMQVPTMQTQPPARLRQLWEMVRDVWNIGPGFANGAVMHVRRALT